MFPTKPAHGGASLSELMSFPPQFEAPSPEELHELLPAYDVLAFIAKGGMGAVYKAHQRSLERAVAIKILPREFGEDEEFRRRFEDEAKAMAKLNHPNLIGVYDFGEVDGMPYIVMEFVDGKSLHHSAHGKVIEQKEVARLVHGICDGLAHAHEAGILHRDIKPANILLDSRKRPKIGDFGLARAADDTEGEGVHFGTPDYTAPEVTKNPDAVDTRSDVYSTGVILYELLTGRLPEASYVPASQIEDVDPRFDKIVRRATHPSPTLRYANAGVMGKEVKVLRDALERSVASIVTKAPITGPIAAPPVAHVAAGEPGPETEAPPPPPPQVRVSTGPNWNLLRNLVIIVILIGAIYGMSRAYKWKQEDNARKEKARDAQEQIEKQERIAEALLAKKAREEAKLKKPLVVQPVNVPKEEKPETAHEALARLKSQLAEGQREEFPPGTHVRGSNRFFFVDTPLSWQRAAASAEEHGGQLATCRNEGEQNWLSSKIPRDTIIWLGGGAISRTSWGWVDGSAWEVRKPSTSTGNCASLSDLGTIRAKPGGEKHPFFIQWRMDGTNPASLESQLERLKNSLETPDPLYPPGVLSFESRRYLIIEKQVSWDEAASIARSAHGHLAVPSERTEDTYLVKAVSNTLVAGEGAWIGGQHTGRAWAWQTGEPWAFAAWAPNAPDGDEKVDTAVRLVAGAKGGWDDGNPTVAGAAQAFIIEWSKDRSTIRAVATPAGGADWAALRAQALAATRAKEGAYAKKLLENGKAMKWDLDFWHRGLSDNEERTHRPSLARLKAKVQRSGKIDIEPKARILLPPRAVQIVQGYLQKEKQLGVVFEREVNNVRESYVEKLKEKKAAAQSGGLGSQVRAIQNEIDSCGKTARTMLEHFGGGSK